MAASSRRSSSGSSSAVGQTWWIIHGKKALNFNISLLVYWVILFILMIPFFIVGTIADVNQEIGPLFWETLILLGISGLS